MSDEKQPVEYASLKRFSNASVGTTTVAQFALQILHNRTKEIDVYRR